MKDREILDDLITKKYGPPPGVARVSTLRARDTTALPNLRWLKLVPERVLSHTQIAWADKAETSISPRTLSIDPTGNGQVPGKAEHMDRPSRAAIQLRVLRYAQQAQAFGMIGWTRQFLLCVHAISTSCTYYDAEDSQPDNRKLKSLRTAH